MRQHIRLLLSVMALLGLIPGTRADDLADKLRPILTAADYKHARWGLYVVDGESGKVVFVQNADQFFAPASVTKLYSCAAALMGLGPEHRFETPVYRRGKMKDGRLKGDLILVAQGDLTLGGRTRKDGTLAFRNVDHTYANGSLGNAELTDTEPLAGLNELAKQVKASGIRRIDGDVLIDDRLFERTQGTGSGPGILTPIVVNDNVVDITLTPAEKAGGPPAVLLRPQCDFIRIDVRVDTVQSEKPELVRVEQVGPQRFVVRGQVKVGAKPLVRVAYVDEPAGFARALFIDALRRAGVAVSASALRPPTVELPERGTYGKLARVASLRSEPLSEVIKVTLKVSHNLYAGTLPLLLAAKSGKRTLAEGLTEQRKVLADLGIDLGAVSFDSAAGGGDADKVTPRATVQLLRAMQKRPEFVAYKAGLPLLGVDGTLATVVKADSPARGKAAAKTGTYGDTNLLNQRIHLRSKALGGYLTTARNHELVFTIFVNDVPLPLGIDPSREGRVIGAICEFLYQFGP